MNPYQYPRTDPFNILGLTLLFFQWAMAARRMAPLLRLKSTRNLIRGKPHPGFGWRAGIAFLILFGVRPLSGGTIGHLDWSSLELALLADAAVRRVGRVGEGFSSVPWAGVGALAHRPMCPHPRALALGLKEAWTARTTSRQAVLGLSICHRKHSRVSQRLKMRCGCWPLPRRWPAVPGRKLAQLLPQRWKVHVAQGVAGAFSLGGQLSAQGGKEGGNNHRAVVIPLY